MKPLNIYIVEDDPDDVFLMTEALQNSSVDFLLEECRHGEEIFEKLDMCKNLPDIILLDLNLPKKDGREVLTLLKSTDKYKGIPVVILTTSSRKTDIEFCVQHGSENYFIKPVTIEEYSKIAIKVVGIAKSKIIN